MLHSRIAVSIAVGLSCLAVLVAAPGTLSAQTYIGPHVSFTAALSTPDNFLDVGTPTRLGFGLSYLRRLGPTFFVRVNAGLRIEQAEFAWAPEQFERAPWDPKIPPTSTQVVVPPASPESRIITSFVSATALELSPTLHVRAAGFGSDANSPQGFYVGAGLLADYVFSFSDEQDWGNVPNRPTGAPRRYTDEFSSAIGFGGVVSAMAMFDLGGSLMTLELAYVARNASGDDANVYTWLPGRGLRFAAGLMF